MKQFRPTLSATQHQWLIDQLDSFARMATRDAVKFADLGAMIQEVRGVIADAEEIEIDEGNKGTGRKADSVFLPNLCKEHPSYTAKRAPSIDCDGHWEAYKKMNPLKYEAARRKFERSQRDADK